METNTTALLVMDMQMGILARLPQHSTPVIEKVALAVKAAREKKLPVIFVRLGFQKGLHEVSPSNKLFYPLKAQLNDSDLDAFMQIHPQLGMMEEDIIVDKKRISAFSGSHLEMVLRARGITHLVLTGVATSGIVLSTVREAFDKDYQLTVLSDGCADADEATHQFLTEKILARQAGVITIDQWRSLVEEPA